jgi:hypothetical protein
MNDHKTTQPKITSSPDLPLSIAIAIALLILFLFLVIRSPIQAKDWINQSGAFVDQHLFAIEILIAGLCFNLIWIGRVLHRTIGFQRRGAKLLAISTQRNRHSIFRFTIVPFFLFTSSLVIGWNFTCFEIPFGEISYLNHQINLGSLINRVSASLTWIGLYLWLERAVRGLRLPISSKNKLPRLPNIQNGIIVGSIHESENVESKNKKNHNICEWVLMGLKGLTGNLLITGVIGSGKSQILLQFLRQILKSFTQRPALLAIDPKRTFVRELRKIIEEQGQQEELLWICLGGKVKFNPIWREGMLTNSVFITIANTLKLASINFLGSSGESRFWEQSSFNLLKNSLVFCAAKYEYFTFKELYRTLIEAREVSLAAELVDYLSTKQWSGEERANIEMAIDYFKNEFSQMDQKIRTSILATATGFLNEFLEYRVSQILSPKKEDLTLFSMTDAIQQGKLILLHIENDALARSVGTLLKLMFEEAVLDRVAHPDHSTARYAVLVMDEYQDVATSGGGAGLGDDRYLAKARESKAITIAATQSVSSLENAIRSEPATRELLQNFRSRIFGNSTDPRTIRLFQEPRGTEEKEKSSHSFSENSQNPTRDLLFGDFASTKSTLSESISTHSVLEHAVTAKEFARLRTFEAFAQIFDGLDTRFEKLFLKPYYLTDLRTPHSKILEGLRESRKVSFSKATLLVATTALATNSLSFSASADILFPNICSVVKTSQFLPCLDFSVSGCMCGWPIPRPCAQISYHVPQTFIEVWPNSKDSFFNLIPGALAQLKAHEIGNPLPFGSDDDMSSYAFQARSIPVPFASETLAALPCGETRMDKPCFDLMSEDLGKNWNTGSADSLQPQYLAWGLAPQACMLKGTATGLAGTEPVPSLGIDIGGCSYPLGSLPKYPPSPREACNGWGLFFPRSGIYEGGSRSIAALMIAARLKSLGVEVSHTIPGGPGETWQMLYPQSSSCFKEGQNPGLLELTKGLREERRFTGKPNGYLFVVWKKVSCCRDIPTVATSVANIIALSAACVVVPGGGT